MICGAIETLGEHAGDDKRVKVQYWLQYGEGEFQWS